MQHVYHESGAAAPANPSAALLRAVRAGLVARGSSLNAWCKARKIMRQNATKALVGDWKGPKATALVAKLMKSARMS